MAQDRVITSGARSTHRLKPWDLHAGCGLSRLYLPLSYSFRQVGCFLISLADLVGQGTIWSSSYLDSAHPSPSPALSASD